ncbi:MAG: hypothetical protein AB8B97_09650 [Granulosicoccus sp.]
MVSAWQRAQLNSREDELIRVKTPMRAGFTPVSVRRRTGCADARFGAQRQRMTFTSLVGAVPVSSVRSVIPKKSQRVTLRATNANLLTLEIPCQAESA